MTASHPFSVATDELTFLVDDDGYYLVDDDGAFLTEDPSGDRWRVMFPSGDASALPIVSRYD